MVLVSVDSVLRWHADLPETDPIPEIPLLTPSSPLASLDYFSIARRLNSQKEPAIPQWARSSPSPTPQGMAPTMSSPTSSRGSWSSLFTTSNMRRLMSGVQKEDEPAHARSARPPAVPGPKFHHPNTPSPQLIAPGIHRKNPLIPPPLSAWSEGAAPSKNVSFTPAGYMTGRPTFSQVVSAERKRIVFERDSRTYTQQ